MKRLSVTLAVVLAGCSGSSEGPSLSVSAKPTRVDDRGESAVITVTGTLASGLPGSGTVALSSGAGTLGAASVSLDSAGKGTTTFACDVSTDIKCSGRVVVTAEWTTSGTKVTATTRVQVGDAGTVAPGGGAGGGGNPNDAGSGGGSGGGTGGGTDAGSTDAGPADSGTPDAGRTDGGSDGGSDAGTVDAGPAPIGYVDAGSVLLIGLLDPAVTSTWAIASFEDVTQPLVGLPPTLQADVAVVRPNGRIVYLERTAAASTRRLLELNSDPYTRVGASMSDYPGNPAANDVVLATPACDTTHPLSDFWVTPDTNRVIYRCSENEYYEGAVQLTAYSGLEIVALGHDGNALGLDNVTNEVRQGDGGVRLITGTAGQSVATLVNANRTHEVRATAQGFLISWGQPGTDAQPCDKWRVGYDGTASKLDTFAGLPGATTATVACSGRIDAQGQLWTIGQSSGDDVVVVRPGVTSGGAVTRYTEADAFESSFTTWPPVVFTFITPSSSLLTGP